MSDHEHDDHGSGAHEVDNMPSRRLFNLLFGLSGLTLLACIGVVQLFNQQVASITDARAAKTSFQLEEYRTEMDEIKRQGGELVINDDDGLTEKQGGKGPHEATRYQMPMAEARRKMLEAPDKHLKAGPAYRGWTSPDPQAAKPAAKGRPSAPRRGAAPGALPGRRPAPARPGAPGARVAPKPQ